MYTEAIKELNKRPKNYPDDIVIYAPTSGWAVSDPLKDKWLKELALRGDLNRFYIVGLSPDPKKQSILDKRINLLLEGGVIVKTLEPQTKFRLGLIHFGDMVLFGFNSKNDEGEFNYTKTKDGKIVDLFRWLVGDATRGAKEITEQR